MTDPVLHVLVGPNGAGKTSFFEMVLAPLTHLPFVNADRIAAARWPADAERRSYEAASIAADERAGLIAARQSFVTETVFSHPSKLDLLALAQAAGYRVTLHVLLIPEELAVARVVNRVENGGHPVPEAKVRARYQRLWGHVAAAVGIVDEAFVYDNSRSHSPFRLVATCQDGQLVGSASWPRWTPSELT